MIAKGLAYVLMLIVGFLGLGLLYIGTALVWVLGSILVGVCAVLVLIVYPFALAREVFS